MTKHQLNGIIFSNYLRLPLNQYLFLVRKLLKRSHLTATQFHKVCRKKWNGDTVAVIKKSKKIFAFTCTHRELALQLFGNRDVQSQVSICHCSQLAKRIRFINTYNMLLYKILRYLIEKQKSYFKSGDVFDLKPLTQKGMADRLKIPGSWIHHIIHAKNVLAPKGEIIPLRTLFFSQKKWVQLRIEAILKREIRNRPYTDQEIQRGIFLKYGRKISLRGICSYRHSLHILSWYKRKEGKYLSCHINFSPEYLLTRKNYKRYVPSKAGIYVFKKGNKCFYVGSSGNLRKRIRAHLYNGSKNKKLSEYICSNRCAFQYALVNCGWKEVERHLYQDFINGNAAPPLFNKMSP